MYYKSAAQRAADFMFGIYPLAIARYLERALLIMASAVLCAISIPYWKRYCNRVQSKLYSSSVTGSCHSLEVFSPGTSTAMCENQLFLFAPCQCLTFAGMTTTSPAFRLRAGLPHSRYQPSPAMQRRICPPPFAA